MQLIPPTPSAPSSAVADFLTLEGEANQQYHFPDFDLFKTTLSPWQFDSLALSYQLWKREVLSESKLADYTFVVFPVAKAYEGFLKDLLLELKLIDEATYASRRFRIGRALNPDVAQNQRDALWLYDDVKLYCGPALAEQLWYTWLECRNHLFHYFPHADQPLTLVQAREKMDQVVMTMEAALACWQQIK
jgi:hypothetical protein